MTKLSVNSVPANELDDFIRSLSANAKVLQPTDSNLAAYNKASIWWADNSKKLAGAIVQVATLDDIVKTVNFSRTHNLDFAVRGGGHSTSGASSTAGGLLLDMSKLNKVTVNVNEKTATVQGGAVGRDVDRETRKHGLAAVMGTVSHTGVGGLTLGGGFGYLTGRHGLMIDNLVCVTIVLADGTVKKASSTENSDLFWAIRGGGGNFGVVYDFVFRVHEQRNDVYTGIFVYAPEKLETVVKAINEWLSTRSADETGIFGIGRLPPDGKPAIAFLPFINNSSPDVFRTRFAPLINAGPLLRRVSAMPYFDANVIYDDTASSSGRKAFKSVLLARLNPDTLRSVYNRYVNFTSKNPETRQSAILIILHSNEKVASVPVNETAFAHRGESFGANVFQKWAKPEDDESIYEWANEVANELKKDSDNPDNGYINLSNVFDDEAESTEGKERKARRVFGSNLDRLKELKRKYDPEIFFDKWVVVWP